MANTLFTATSPADVFNQLVAFLVGSAGYTLYDTITSTDKVYTSSGGISGTRTPIYIRITASFLDEAPGDMPCNAFDNILFRLYRTWNAGAHTGTGETSKLGPRIWQMPQDSGFGMGVLLPTTSKFFQYSDIGNNTWLAQGVTRSPVIWDGRAFIWGQGQTTVGIRGFEVASGTESMIYATGGILPGMNLISTVDKNTGRMQLWFIKQSPTANNTFYKYDMLGKTLTAMTDPPWGATFSYCMPSCWDGNDKIYYVAGTGSASAFAYYSIGAGTWTSLTAIPATGTWQNDSHDAIANNKMIYVPAALSGAAHDFIYAMFPTNGDSTWHKYDVTANTWTASNGTTFANLPVVKAQFSSQIFLDPSLGANGTIYYVTGVANGPTKLYSYDINTNVFSAQIAAWNNSTITVNSNNSTDLFMLRSYPGMLVLPTTSSTLSIQVIANKDYIALCAAWTPPGYSVQIQRWAFIGYYNTYLNQNRFTLNGSVTSGAAKVLTTNEVVTNLLAPGDLVEIIDTTASVLPQARGQAQVRGGGELAQVISLPTAHQILVSGLVNGYPNGASVGQDILNAGLCNDGLIFIDMNHPSKGYQGDGEQDWYRLQPALAPVLRSLIGTRTLYPTSSLQLYNTQSQLGTNELVGEIYGIFLGIPVGNLGDQLVVTGHPYLIMQPWNHTQMFTSQNFALGPTDL